MRWDLAKRWKMREVPVRRLEDRIKEISKLIDEGKKDPLIRYAAARIIQKCPARDWGCEVKALFDFVQRNIRYTRDVEGMDTYQRARRTLQLGAGDCDDMTILLGALLQTVGYPIKLKAVSVTGEGYEHIYPLVGLPPREPGRWVPLDASVPRPLGWEVSPIAYAKVFRL